MPRKTKAKAARPVVEASLPDTLAALKDQARRNRCPGKDSGLFNDVLPSLYELLGPAEVVVTDGNQKPKLTWREPLLMVSWSTSIGGWQWSITHKVLKVTVRGQLTGLQGMAEEIDKQIASRAVEVRSLE